MPDQTRPRFQRPILDTVVRFLLYGDAPAYRARRVLSS